MSRSVTVRERKARCSSSASAISADPNIACSCQPSGRVVRRASALSATAIIAMRAPWNARERFLTKRHNTDCAIASPRATAAKMKLSLLFVFVMAAGAQAACGSDVWPSVWKNYADRFMDEQVRVIDHDADDRTTSEAQAYAMFFALVANDRSRFD